MSSCVDHPISQSDHLFTRLRSFPFVKYTDQFFMSKLHFLLIGALTVLSNLFGLELPVYCCFIAFGIYISLFGKDLLPLIPIIICCYIAPSRDNNPGINPDSIFYPENGGILLIILVALFAACVAFRLALDPQIGRRSFLKAKRKLLPGIIALGCAYLLAGAFSGNYFANGWSNTVFAALQFASILLPYYLLTGAVKWDEAHSRYFAWAGICVGFSVLIEILAVYIIADPIVGNEIDRNRIYTGWGNYNNMGALLAMMIPFAFQLGCTKKRSWLYSLCGGLFLMGVLLTCSRTSIIIGVAIFVASVMELFLNSRYRRICVRTNLIAFAIMGTLVLIFYHDVIPSYIEIFTIQRSISSRFAGFEEGIMQFMKYPLFGGSFYATDYYLEEWSTVDAFTSFFPARWHNTPIQLVASCGIMGFAAYAYHRLQTIYLIMSKQSIENIYIVLSVCALLLTSLFDCHFFNIGPTLFYSMALAFAEKYTSPDDPARLPTFPKKAT